MAVQVVPNMFAMRPESDLVTSKRQPASPFCLLLLISETKPPSNSQKYIDNGSEN